MTTGLKARTMLNRSHVFAMRAKWERVALASLRQGFQDELEAVRAGGPAAIDPNLWVPILLAYWKGAAYAAFNYTTATILANLKAAEKVGSLSNMDSDLLAMVIAEADQIAAYNADALDMLTGAPGRPRRLPSGLIEDLDADYGDLYDGWSGGRAENMARTDSTAAVGYGQSQAAKAFPLLKTWLAVGDAATRPTHITANGQTIPVADMYIVGGARLDYPGDPGGPAAEVANCRCWENYAQVG